MQDSRIFCNAYYEQREKAIHNLFGERLDGLRENISQLYSSCEIRSQSVVLESLLLPRSY